MKNFKKIYRESLSRPVLRPVLRSVLLSVLLSFGMISGSVQAAETRTAIRQVPLHIQSTIESGSSSGDIYVTSDSTEFRVGDVEILNENTDWIGGMKPRAEISLYASSGYYFYSSSKSMFSFSGDEVSYVTSHRDNDKTELTVTIRLDALENGDLTVTGLEWDEGNGTAMWDENPSAKSYQVRLFRDGKAVTASRSTHESFYEFGGDITRKGDYYFEVRAVGSGSEKGDWESSDTWFVTSWEADDLSTGFSDGPGSSGSYAYGGPGDDGSHGTAPSYGNYSGGPGTAGYQPGGPGTTGYQTGGPGAAGSGNSGYWCLDQYGWWYRNPDGSYTRNNWQVIDGRYYFFNESGYMRTGWIPWNNRWYYCGSDGALQANCRTPDGYYVGGDGVWIP